MKQGLPQTNVFVISDFCGETIPLTVGTTSTFVTFVNASSAKNYDIMVTNAGTKKAFIAFGLASQAGGVVAQVPSSGGGTGTTNATPVLGGAKQLLDCRRRLRQRASLRRTPVSITARTRSVPRYLSRHDE